MVRLFELPICALDLRNGAHPQFFHPIGPGNTDRGRSWPNLPACLRAVVSPALPVLPRCLRDCREKRTYTPETPEHAFLRGPSPLRVPAHAHHADPSRLR